MLLSMSLWQATHFFPRVCLLRGESTAVSVFCAEPFAVSPDACHEKNITKMARMPKRHFEDTATIEPPEHSQTPVSLDDALAPLPAQTKTSIRSTTYQTSEYIVIPRNRHVVDHCQSNDITTHICTFLANRYHVPSRIYSPASPRLRDSGPAMLFKPSTSCFSLLMLSW